MIEKYVHKSPLARLMLFLVCLSLFGGIIGGAHYYLVDLPEQEYALHPPTNSGCTYFGTCKFCADVAAFFTFGACFVSDYPEGHILVYYLCCPHGD